MKANNSGGKEYLKWSGIAMQGIAVILVLLFVGRYFDGKIEMETPIFTITGILLGVCYFFYSLFRAVSQK
jgi:F0F1-type ATP synthase assembly protein I